MNPPAVTNDASAGRRLGLSLSVCARQRPGPPHVSSESVTEYSVTSAASADPGLFRVGHTYIYIMFLY